jgi:magnesium chelatase subunit D
MKLALLLAAVDWRLGVLLRGDKGSGKTTTARALAALLPTPARFVNLPLGTTEDRLLGGLHLERALQGEPVLKPGLLAEANGGVLYVDEVNLLPAHLGDTLLDAAASGVHVVEREGFSAMHASEFVLLGSMNPEEGSLRPQLLDRFALSVTVSAPLHPAERRTVVERRIAFERDADEFQRAWSQAQTSLQAQILAARASHGRVVCPSEMMEYATAAVCDHGIRSMRADLAVVRSAVACAALHNEACVEARHIDAVLPLVLAHRRTEGRRSPAPPPPPARPPQATLAGEQENPELENPAQENPAQESPAQDSPEQENTNAQHSSPHFEERIFTPAELKTLAFELQFSGAAASSGSAMAEACNRGPVIGTRRTELPTELDVRATLSHSLRETGVVQPRMTDLHERVRQPQTGTRYLFVIDSSGSHAAQQRMRLVKGAIAAVLKLSFKRGDEVVMIAFRGTSAQTVLAPTSALPDAMAALEYLPTGGRTPLASGLDEARRHITPTTLLVLLTDGRANVALHGGDPWKEALDAARLMVCSAIVVDTENPAQRLGQCAELAKVLGARYTTIEDFASMDNISLVPAQMTRRP